MTDPLEVPTQVQPADAVPVAEDAALALSPEEEKIAIDALPVKGHICILTPRVEVLEKKLDELGAAFQALVPLLTAGKEFAERVSALEEAVAAIKSAPASPVAHDARLRLVEDAVEALKPLVPAIEKHFGKLI